MMAIRIMHAAPWAHPFMPRMMCSREPWSRGVGGGIELCVDARGWIWLLEVSSCSYSEETGVCSSAISSVKRDCRRWSGGRLGWSRAAEGGGKGPSAMRIVVVSVMVPVRSMTWVLMLMCGGEDQRLQVVAAPTIRRESWVIGGLLGGWL
jgi:hypothetical protein